jgi:hypothetical protein
MVGANGISHPSITTPDWDVLRGGRDSDLIASPRVILSATFRLV